MTLTPCECPYPKPLLTCFRAEDGTLVSVMKEFDKGLNRWHISIGAYPRVPSDEEALMAVEAVMAGEGKAWSEVSAVVNPHVRHFFEAGA